MLNRIEKLQGGLVRAESYVLVVCVMAMLLLAAYNVFYRNVLVPLQIDLREVQRAAAPEKPRSDDESEGKTANRPDPEGGAEASEDESEDSESGGFGGGFGGESDESDDEEDAGSSGGEFRGGFGSGNQEEQANDGESGGSETDDTSDGDQTGFEGGFGSNSGGSEGEESDGESTGDFEGEFGNSPEDKSDEGKAREATSDEPAAPGKAEGPGPAEQEPGGSWASVGVRTIDSMKIGWVDTFLRHMVLVTGFLGGMIAVRRREHITIDAVGRLLTGRIYHATAAVTNLFATVVCGALGWAGWDLVALSLKFPEELMPGVQTWVVQMVFPVGFGMIGFHFLLLAAQNATRAYRDEPIERARAEDAPNEGDEADREGTET